MTILVTVFITAALTLLAGLLVVNSSVPARKVETDTPHLYAADDLQFLRSMGLLLGASILEGNKPCELINGNTIFLAMLEVIRQVGKTSCLRSLSTGQAISKNNVVKAMAERARAGVKVPVLLDWVCSVRTKDSIIDTITDAGVEVERFHAPRWYNLGRLNNRTHRKPMIADGAIGFTGGVGIGIAMDRQRRKPGPLAGFILLN